MRSNPKPRLFIGSSRESADIANALHLNLREYAEVTVWSQGVFKLSSTALESLLIQLDNSDFALFIFSPDDLVTIRGDESAAVRDNVILELGLFLGRLGRDRCFILQPDKAPGLRLPTDLLGLIWETYESNRTDGNLEAATGPASYRIRLLLQGTGPRIQSTEPPRDADVPGQQSQDLTAEITTDGTPTPTSKRLPWLILYTDRRYDEALEGLTAEISQENDQDRKVDLMAWKGRIKYNIDPSEGGAELKALIEQFPRHSDPYIHLIYAHLNRDRHSDALPVIQDGLKNADDNLEILQAQARYFGELGEEDQAENTLLDSVKKHPYRSNSHIHLSNYYQDKNRWEDSRAVLEKANQQIPDYEGLLSAHAKLIVDHFDPKEALPIYNKLITISPESPDHRVLRGNLYLLLKLFDLAMRDYKRANELADGKHAWILANIGNLFKNRGLYAEGIFYLNQVLELQPEDQYAHERLAQSLTLTTQQEEKMREVLQEVDQTQIERRQNLGP